MTNLWALTAALLTIWPTIVGGATGKPSATTETSILRAVISAVAENEHAEARDGWRVPVRLDSYLPPARLLERALTGTPNCDLTLAELTVLTRELGDANRKSVRFQALLDGLELVEESDGLGENDSIGLSRPVLLEGGKRAVLSVDISRMAGAIGLLELRGDEWELVAECMEWTAY